MSPIGYIGKDGKEHWYNDTGGKRLVDRDAEDAKNRAIAASLQTSKGTKMAYTDKNGKTIKVTVNSGLAPYYYAKDGVRANEEYWRQKEAEGKALAPKPAKHGLLWYLFHLFGLA